LGAEARNVYRCAVAAQLAYLSAHSLEAEAKRVGFTLVARLDRGRNNGVVLDLPGVRIVAFRGTDEAADWRTNLNLLPRSTPWGRVHRGFQDATASFWPDVAARVREATAAGQKIWVTGHSLGGAIATLAAVRLFGSNEATVDLLCTFGQPPVGGSRFCTHCQEKFGERYIRCVNHTDAVADDVSLWREHSGTLWYFDVDGVLHHTVSWRRSAADHVRAPQMYGGLSQFGAHGMAKYLPLLRSLVETDAASD